MSAAPTNGAITNTTLDYTNSAGVSGRTGALGSVASGSNAGCFYIFQLQAGDTGVRSIQGITLGTSYVGLNSLHLVAFRPIIDYPFLYHPQISNLDPVGLGFPRCYDNTVPFVTTLCSSASATSGIFTLQFAHG